MQQTTQFCQQCQRQTLHARNSPNHLIHALCTLFLCGFWAPIWILVSLSSSSQPFRCQSCGGTPARPVLSAFWIVVIVACVVTAVLYGMIQLNLAE